MRTRNHREIRGIKIEMVLVLDVYEIIRPCILQIFIFIGELYTCGKLRDLMFRGSKSDIMMLTVFYLMRLAERGQMVGINS